MATFSKCKTWNVNIKGETKRGIALPVAVENATEIKGVLETNRLEYDQTD